MTDFVTLPLMMRSSRSFSAVHVRAVGIPVAAVIAMVSGGAFGQDSVSDSGQRRGVSIVPTVSITETLTDNVGLASTGQQADQITEISPGIRISGKGARLKGYFDYSLSKVVYAQNTSSNRYQNALNTFATLEAVDNWAFIDFSGAISQQAISAFGTQSVSNTSTNSNRTEVRNYRISPYVRGRLGDMADYEARYSRAITQSDAPTGSNVLSADGVVTVSGASAFRNLGWTATAGQQTVDYSTGRPTELDRLNLGLSYSITSQLSVTANAGREANNYTSIDKQTYATHGVGVNWAPTENTKFSASKDQRSFGDGHNISFQHRTARTVWIFTDAKDVSVTPTQTGVASLGSVYDILYNQFAARVPDSVARAQLVDAFLQANSISPDAKVFRGFLTSAVSLQRRQDLSFALLGVRDTVTFIASRSESSRLDALSLGVDDFNSASVVRQHGFSVNYSHRLTPDYSLGIQALQQNTSGDSSLQDSTLQLVSVNLTGKVGRRATVTVVVRRVVSSGTAPYAENAVVGSLTLQF